MSGNSMSGSAAAVVQARSITGDVHVHGPVPTFPEPRQLPALPRGFVGRAEQVAELNALLEQDSPRAVVISAIDGVAGIGKTALALYWAHQVVDQFPDGQLYVNLQGFSPSGTPIHPAEALRGFFNAFQVPVDSIPAELEAQSALYRSLLAGRRVLVVLDNARDAEQVRPLLPGCAECAVVITSRNRLGGLVAREGARLVTLDVLGAEEAGRLLAHRLGANRTRAEPAAVSSLIQCCARLPLALAVASARAAARPAFPLGELVAELRDERHRLRALNAGDAGTDLEAVFSWSYRALEPAAAALFRCLGAHPGAEISLDAVAALGGVQRDEARVLLGELIQANLVEEHVPGRYRQHDLLRLYARHQASAEDHGARARILIWYRDRTAAAVAWLESRLDVDRYFPTSSQAVLWLETERANLVSAVTEGGDPSISAEIACLLSVFLQEYRHFDDWQHTLTVADAVADPSTKTTVLLHLQLVRARGLCDEAYDTDEADRLAGSAEPGIRADAWGITARCHHAAGWPVRATAAAKRSLAGHRERGDLRAQAWALTILAEIYNYQLLFDETSDCLSGALRMWRQLGDRWYEADVLVRRARADRMRTHIGEALRYLDQALSIYHAFQDGIAGARTLSLRGDILRQYGAATQAHEAHRTAHRVVMDAGALREEADVLAELIESAQAVGAFDLCEQYLDRWAAVAGMLGDPEAVVATMCARGRFHTATGNHAQAVRTLRNLFESATTLRDEAQGMILRDLGRGYAAQGRVKDAVDCFVRYLGLAADRATWRSFELIQAQQEFGLCAEVIAGASELVGLFHERADFSAECWSLEILAGGYAGIGRYDQVVAVSQRAVDIRSTMGVDSYRLGWSLTSMAHGHEQAGRSDQALTCAREALAVRERAHNHYGVVQSLGMLAEMHLARREFGDARARLEQLVALSTPDMIDPAQEPLVELVSLYAKQCRFAEAEYCYQQALLVLRRVDDEWNGLRLQRYVGRLRVKEGRAEDALELFRHNLATMTEKGNLTGASAFRAEIVSTLIELRRFDDARVEVGQGLVAAERVESDIDRIRFLSFLGEINRKQGNFGEAAAAFATACALCERNGDLRRISRLAHLGQTYLDAGEADRAAAAYRTRSELEQGTGDERKLALALAELAGALAQAGHRDEARQLLGESATKSDRLEDPWHAASNFGACARAARRLEAPDQVISYYRRQAELSGACLDLGAEAQAWSDLAEHHRIQAQFADAINHHRRGLEISTELGDPIGITDQLRKLGVVMSMAGRPATDLLRESLTRAHTMNDTARIADANEALARDLERSGKPDQARQHYDICRSLYRQLGDVKANREMSADAG